MLCQHLWLTTASWGTGAYVNPFRDGKVVPAEFSVGFYPYDWLLNAWK